MLSNTSLFKDIICPFYASGLCERPFCHFKHVKADSLHVLRTVVAETVKEMLGQLTGGNYGDAATKSEGNAPSYDAISSSWTTSARSDACRRHRPEKLWGLAGCLDDVVATDILYRIYDDRDDKYLSPRDRYRARFRPDLGYGRDVTGMGQRVGYSTNDFSSPPAHACEMCEAVHGPPRVWMDDPPVGAFGLPETDVKNVAACRSPFDRCRGDDGRENARFHSSNLPSVDVKEEQLTFPGGEAADNRFHVGGEKRKYDDDLFGQPWIPTVDHSAGKRARVDASQCNGVGRIKAEAVSLRLGDGDDGEAARVKHRDGSDGETSDDSDEVMEECRRIFQEYENSAVFKKSAAKNQPTEVNPKAGNTGVACERSRVKNNVNGHVKAQVRIAPVSNVSEMLDAKRKLQEMLTNRFSKRSLFI